MTAGSARHAIEPRVSTKATPTGHRPADRPQAIADIAVHIQRLWEPRMRRQLLAHVEEHRGDGIDPMVLDALRQLR
ncbi:formate dehydrogenase subunit delta [Variovorax sp. J22R115]|uniref:formate dehydrogenase subunit delta n=1 Tax=Variovorax sp. J22R115 TaxID=3053509 RepID=UPI0025790401|nr:formate dehydrogenase subunit delta [Variovorax sp. J22R115]MDM0052522.1 formate dehydrogenase subunit delta [Variovorax sp. J22R115]